jgi:hypothetical protein
MESVYHIVTIRVNETSWAHVWRLHSHYLGTGYDKEAEFQDLEQEVMPETSPVKLKELPPALWYVFLNGDRESPVIISDKLSNDKTQRLVATLLKYRSVIGNSLKDLKRICPSLCTYRIPMEQEHKPIHEH